MHNPEPHTVAELKRVNRALSHEIKDLRRQAEGERQAGEAKVRSFLDAASQAVIGVGADGRIVLVNRRTEEMFGYSERELLGQNLEKLLPARYRHGHVQRRSEYFKEPHVRTMGVGMDLAGRRKDRTEFPVEVGLGYVNTEEGKLALGLVIDITERKRSADELAQANADLRRSNLELEQFAYICSHDLQEPLRMITSYLNLLDRRYSGRLDADASEFIRYAVDGANRMKILIRDVLSFSRVRTSDVKLRAISAEAVLQMALSNLKTAIDESGAKVTWDPLPSIFVDSALFTLVFQNLIGNAIKFRKEGQPKVHVSAKHARGECVLTVSDNGIGIDPQHGERIFQIFQRLNPPEQFPGTGVGLAISKKIVERHGGRIWVESASGEGACFCFSIPNRLGKNARAQSATSD